MSELTSMMNIGKEMAKKLISVGIESSEKLIETGAKDAFLRLKQKYPNVCLVPVSYTHLTLPTIRLV